MKVETTTTPNITISLTYWEASGILHDFYGPHNGGILHTLMLDLYKKVNTTKEVKL